MTKIERELRRRERRRMADLNKNSEEVFRSMVRTTVVGMMLLAGIIILLLASAVRADQEAFAATLRRTRLIREEMAEDRTYYHVPPLPELPPEDGEPPEAIEIITKDATAAEAVPAERWESLGVWKLTAYCPCEKCNGRGRAWKTASGAPMVVGRTVAVGGLPFGTELMINGQTYVVEDRGVHGRHVDILHESHAAASRFGIQRAEVFIKR